jgi:hypothetical protein
MSSLLKPWLEDFDWEFVTEVNRGLCNQKGALHKPTSDGHAPAKQLWEQSRVKNLSFSEALQVCLRCHRLAPFCFYNGNTFAAIARDMIEDISTPLSPEKAHILRSVAGHIVAGTATDVEMKQLGGILGELKK